MEVIFHKQFKKKLEKLPRKIRDQFYDRLELFIKDQNHKMLNNHSVDKAFTNCRSINVTGDYRAIFEENQNIVTFIIIGTHSELY
jgi:addiction module RelE/StbE family toxin